LPWHGRTNGIPRTIIKDDRAWYSHLMSEHFLHRAGYTKMSVGKASDPPFIEARETHKWMSLPEAQGEHGIAEIVPVNDEPRSAEPRRETRDQKRGNTGRVLDENDIGPWRATQEYGECTAAEYGNFPEGSGKKKDSA
jgi:hypothetical protein